MKKKRFSRILFPILFALILPVVYDMQPLVYEIKAAEPEHAGIDVSQYNFTFNSIDGSRIPTTNTNSVEPKTNILIFGQIKCGKTRGTIQNIAGSDWINNDDIRVIFVDIRGYSKEEIQDFADAYGSGCDKINYCYKDDSYVAGQAACLYRDVFDGKEPNLNGAVKCSTPVAVFIDKENYMHNVIEGQTLSAAQIQTEIDKINDSADEEPTTPPSELPGQEDLYYSFRSITGETVNSSMNGKTTMLIFGPTDCAYTRKTLQNIAASRQLTGDSHLRIVFAESGLAEQVEVEQYVSNFACDKITFCYDPMPGDNSINTAKYKYAALEPGHAENDVVTTPLIILIDENQRVRKITQGEMTAEELENAVNELPGSVSGPSEGDEPDQSEEPSESESEEKPSAPDTEEVPDVPEEPSESESEEKPSDSDTEEVPEEPEEPSESESEEKPSDSDTEEVPEEPEEPSESNTEEDSSAPGTETDPSDVEKPDDSESSSTSGTEEPSNPETPDDSESSSAPSTEEKPSESESATEPESPSEPSTGEQPTQPEQPVKPSKPAKPSQEPEESQEPQDSQDSQSSTDSSANTSSSGTTTMPAPAVSAVQPSYTTGDNRIVTGWQDVVDAAYMDAQSAAAPSDVLSGNYNVNINITNVTDLVIPQATVATMQQKDIDYNFHYQNIAITISHETLTGWTGALDLEVSLDTKKDFGGGFDAFCITKRAQRAVPQDSVINILLAADKAGSNAYIFGRNEQGEYALLSAVPVSEYGTVTIPADICKEYIILY